MATIYAVQNGPFGFPGTWSNNQTPSLGNDYIIPEGITVSLDGFTGEIGSDSGSNNALEVQGNLTWTGNDDCTITFYGNLKQTNNGTINLSYKGGRDKVCTFYLNASSNLDYVKYGLVADDITKVILDGWEFQNCWAYTIQETPSGSNTIYVDPNRIQEWQVGDKLLIGVWATQRTITNINYSTGEIELNTSGSWKSVDSIVNKSLPNIQILPFNPEYIFNVNISNNTTVWNVDGSYIEFKRKWGTNFTKIIKNIRLNSSIVYANDIKIYDGKNSALVQHSIGGVTNAGAKMSGTFDNFMWTDDYSNGSWGINNLDGVQKCTNCYFGTYFYYTLQNNIPVFENCIFSKHQFSRLWRDNTSNQRIKFINCQFESCNQLQFAHSDTEIINPSFNVLSNYNNTTVKATDCDLILKNIKHGHDVLSPVIETKYADNASVRYYTETGESYFKDKYKSYTNQTTIKYNNNKSVEIEALSTNPFTIELTTLISQDESYKWTILVGKEQANSNVKLELVDVLDVLDSSQTTNKTYPDWESLSVGLLATKNAFITLRLTFTPTIANEKFWISDEFNSFEYWKDGDLIPLYPKHSMTLETIAKAVWEYNDRSLDTVDNIVSAIWNYTTRSITETVSTIKDNLLTQIKDKVKRFRFTLDNKIISHNNNPSFTESDRQKLFSLKNYDDRVIKKLAKDIYDAKLGNWEIVDNKFIIYRDDGTELVRFALYDEYGKPSTTNVHKRERIK